MKLHRFIGTFLRKDKTIFITDPFVVHQMTHVLHLKPGEQVGLCDGKGGEVVASFVGVEKQGVKCEVIEERAPLPAFPIVTLCCAVLKRENFEWVVQKATEVGVSKIIPIITARTVKQSLRLDRLQKIALEASEQCGRRSVPVIESPQLFKQAMVIEKGEVGYFFDKDGELFLTISTGAHAPSRLFIGPEGGWDETEVKLAREVNCSLVSLGPLTLRGETAAVVASYLATR